MVILKTSVSAFCELRGQLCARRNTCFILDYTLCQVPKNALDCTIFSVVCSFTRIPVVPFSSLKHIYILLYPRLYSRLYRLDLPTSTGISGMRGAIFVVGSLVSDSSILFFTRTRLFSVSPVDSTVAREAPVCLRPWSLRAWNQGERQPAAA